MSQDTKKHIKVTLVWGGTGESKPANPEFEDTAGSVFADVYKRFQQQASDQDTFEVNEGSTGYPCNVNIVSMDGVPQALL